ncbi:MAG: TnpV protein [Ruminococcaceae bacterium]|nr:TnpV protein [Oscillospiraceae bacterium]
MREITYHQEGNYQIPNLVLPVRNDLQLGRYSELRRKFLKEHHRVKYTSLLTQCRLDEHLAEIQTRATEMRENLIKEMAAKEGLTEELKASDMMTWVQGMNNLRNRVEEIVLSEVIYQ